MFWSLIKEGQWSHNIRKCPGTPMFYTTGCSVHQGNIMMDVGEQVGKNL